MCHLSLFGFYSTGINPKSSLLDGLQYVSEPFCVSNRVRLGGILSPAFFIVFVDELRVWLRLVCVGWYIGDYKNKVWRAMLSWIFRARKAWWSHLQARRRSLRA